MFPFLVAAVLLVGAVGIGILTIVRLISAMRLVNHSYEVIVAVNRCVAGVSFAANEQRGFLVTGNPAFVARFKQARMELDQMLRETQGLVANRAASSRRFGRMRDLAERRIAELSAALEARQNNVSESAGGGAESISVATMLELRHAAREINASESATVRDLHAKLEESGMLAGVASGVTALLAMVMAGYNLRLMRKASLGSQREEKLIRARDQAERSERETNAFLANVSHEIRTPMNAVLGFADLLRGVVTTSKQSQYVESIRSSGRNLLMLIDDILDLSKIEAGRFQVSQRPMSIRALISGVHAIFERQALERGINLNMDVKGNVPPVLVFDSARLRQILFNVVGNAIKFTPSGSVDVVAEASATGRDERSVMLTIRVRDTGVGIAPEDQRIVFEPFRQAGAGLDRKYGGTGLGLSITERLVDFLGGRIELESRKGVGTEFRFHFPEVAISAAHPQGGEADGSARRFDLLRPSLLLVADPVLLNRDSLAHHLEGSHHHVLFAATAAETVDMARHFEPDLILMSTEIPGESGPSVLGELRSDSRTARIPLIALAAAGVAATPDGFDGSIRAPLLRRNIFHALAEFLPPDERDLDATNDVSPRDREALGADHPPDDFGAFQDFLCELRRNSWPDLVQSMGTLETTEFGRELLRRAEGVGCARLVRYARRLLEQVDQFEITEVEATLKEFPRLVEELLNEGPPLA